jgi:hypothetical protein
MLREIRYLVLKKTDIEKLTNSEREILSILVNRINLIRIDAEKNRIQCVVVEHDWPEYEPTLDAIEKRISAKIKSRMPE